MVFQDFRLFGMTLGENVAGSSRYEKNRAWDCLEKAGFSERAAKMDQGLETYLYRELEEDGVEISGGEAQKIAMARALYQDAPFLILDEPTAALDPIAESRLYENFAKLGQGKSSILITHRLGSVKICDQILVLDGGRLIQQGTHERLMEQEGLYRRMFREQSKWYQ